MGLILRILLAAGLLLAAVLLPVVRNRKPAEDTDPRTARLEDLANRRRAALQLWSATAVRDSLLRRLPQLEDSASGLRVWLQGFPAEVRAAALERSSTAVLGNVGTIDSTIGLGILVYNVEAFDQQSPWGPYAGAWIGAAGNKTWCVAIVPGMVRKRGGLETNSQSAFSPCLLFAAFGKPGAPIEAWLRATRYASTGSNNWLSRPKGWRDGFGEAPWRSLYDPSWFAAMVEVRSSRFWRLGPGDLMTTLGPPYQLGTLALRCLAGDSEFCARAVTDTTAHTNPLAGWPSDLILEDRWFTRRVTDVLGPRPVAYWYLSDLIRDQGRDRFQLFWRSNQPVEEAFHLAFGEDLGVWTERWARVLWEESSERHFGSREVLLGVTMKGLWIPLSIGWSLLALAAVAWTARRKQVT